MNPTIPCHALTHICPVPPPAMAVALSGGPDSMALLHLMTRAFPQTRIAALTFDHGLRREASSEAKRVGAWIADWPNVTHHILKWTGKKPQTAVMEAAREARYRALTRWCMHAGIEHLWVAHHAGDQAETFFFRLAKGSGLDGLGGMTSVLQGDVALMRPLLDRSKDDLLAYCMEHDITYVDDPSNRNQKYARPRLRTVMPGLAEEGLTEQRLTKTMDRLRRARVALDFYSDRLIADAVTFKGGQAVLNYESFAAVPEEIRLRSFRAVIARFGKGEKQGAYGPRLDRLEDLWAQMWRVDKPLNGFTIAGLKISLQARRNRIVIEDEKA